MREDSIASNQPVVINTANTTNPISRGPAIESAPWPSCITNLPPEPTRAKNTNSSTDVDMSIEAIDRVLHGNCVEHVRPGSLIRHAGVTDLLVSRFGIDIQDSDMRLPKITEVFAKASMAGDLKDLSSLTQRTYLQSARTNLVMLDREISEPNQLAFRNYLNLLDKRHAKDQSAG